MIGLFLLVSACGSSTGDAGSVPHATTTTTGTRAGFVAQANDICATARAKIAATPTTPFRPYLVAGARALREERDSLRALHAPSAMASGFAEYLAKFDQVVARVGEALKLTDDDAAQRAFEGAGALAAAARDDATKLGIDECGVGKPIHVPVGAPPSTARP